MRQGEVWLVALPFVSGGHEQAGPRPAVVLQDGVYGQGSPLVLVAPLTSQLGALRFPATVRIEASTENGLNVPSVAMVFQIRALDRTRFVRRLGEIKPETMESILEELDKLTGR